MKKNSLLTRIVMGTTFLAAGLTMACASPKASEKVDAKVGPTPYTTNAVNVGSQKVYDTDEISGNMPDLFRLPTGSYVMREFLFADDLVDADDNVIDRESLYPFWGLNLDRDEGETIVDPNTKEIRIVPGDKNNIVAFIENDNIAYLRTLISYESNNDFSDEEIANDLRVKGMEIPAFRDYTLNFYGKDAKGMLKGTSVLAVAQDTDGVEGISSDDKVYLVENPTFGFDHSTKKINVRGSKIYEEVGAFLKADGNAERFRLAEEAKQEEIKNNFEAEAAKLKEAQEKANAELQAESDRAIKAVEDELKRKKGVSVEPVLKPVKEEKVLAPVDDDPKKK